MLCAKFGWNWPMQWFWRRRFFNFVNVFSLFRYYLPLEKGGTLHLNKLEFPSSRDTLCQIWLKLAHLFWRRRFFNLINVFSLFHNYLPLEMGGAFLLNKLESPSLKDTLCQIWLKLAQLFWRRRVLNFINVFSLFRNYISLWKRAVPFIWKNLNPLHPGILCAKFGWNWPSGSGEQNFLISSMYFHYFVLISPLKKGGAHHLNKLESPSPKDALC